MGRHSTAVAIVTGLVLLASVTGGVAAGSDGTAAGTGDGQEREQRTQDGRCAPAPPDGFADPDGDPLGWEEGYWYGESIDVNRSDGLNDSELRTLIARTMARVESIRCLEFDERPPVRVIDRERFGRQERTRNASPALRTFDNAKFEALFLINESADSLAVQNANTGSNVLGYYSDRTDEIVLVSEPGTNLRVDEITLAHELVHALQDQRFGLASFDDRLRDEANAEAGLVEGDARYVDYLYRQRCRGDWNGTCSTPGRRGGGQLANVGVYFVKYMPYSDGPPFVQRVREEGGWEAVNALYDDPPESSEQVIHPEKYGTDPPTNVSLADRSGDAWTRVRPRGRPDYAELGEGALAAMFAYPTYHSGGRAGPISQAEWLNTTARGQPSEFDPIDYDTNYTDGWDGDRLHVYEGGGGETAYVWRIAWDSPADAREFASGYRRLLDYWGAERVGPDTYRVPEGGEFADAFHVAVDGSTVTITNAPTVGDLPAVNGDVSADAASNGTATTGTA